jgi:hypothetical protein
MRTINILDKTYHLLEVILKEEQIGQIERHGKPISETPEDMIPWLIGYYQGSERFFKARNRNISKIIDADEFQKVRK